VFIEGGVNMSTSRPDNLSADDATKRLQQGNTRYVAGSMERPRCTPDRRESLTGGQAPFATVLTCADSRVAPELIFDQGIGDLFVIRVAGNIADAAVLGSIEYASLHLGVNLVVVMGHQSCGAVGAAVDNKDFDGPATQSNIDSLIDAIKPAVQNVVSADASVSGAELLESSVRENARRVSGGIRSSEAVLAKLESAGLRISPAYYSLSSGDVSWL